MTGAGEKDVQEKEKTDHCFVIQRVDWWLAQVSRYGYACSLCDGPHSDRERVEQALYLIRSLEPERGRKFCCVRVEQSDIQPVAHDVEHESGPIVG